MILIYACHVGLGDDGEHLCSLRACLRQALCLRSKLFSSGPVEDLICSGVVVDVPILQRRKGELTHEA